MKKSIPLLVLASLVLTIPATVAAAPAVAVRLVAEGLTSPLTAMNPPDGTGRLFIVDQVGLIRIVTADGVLLPGPFLDLRAQIVPLMPDFDERGLLGLAFHPQYAQNGRFFVYYTVPLRPGGPEGFDHTGQISEFSVSAQDPNRADPASERILLQWDHPEFNHNGGTVAFGPDGFLYISIGDGGGGNDVGLGHVEDWYADNAGGNGQDITQNLLGNILRIDIDGGFPYAIPPDNPFVGAEGLDEIFAYGFRNPYRMSFDMGGSHSLFVGDAGQELWEEVDLVVKGGNYGWNVREGTHCFDAENPFVSPPFCPDAMPDGTPLLDPIIEYANTKNPEGGLGFVVVGGYVYRGDALPQFKGRYIFGDWSTPAQPDGSVFVAKPRSNGLWHFRELRFTNTANGRLNHNILGFGQDAAGEVYVCGTQEVGPTGTTGKVFQLVRANSQ
jgi:glucose/arabinose dehydrogenase